MSDERTEKATPKRQTEARKKGQVPKSQDFNSAIMLTIALYLLFIYLPSINENLKSTSINTFSNLDPNLVSKENLIGFCSTYISLMFNILIPIMMILLAGGLIINYVQIGPLFSTEAIKPNFEKLNPMNFVNGLKNFFNLRSMVELAKSFIKMGIVAGVAYSVIDARKMDILSMLGAELPQILAVIGSIIFEMLLKICIILVILGIIDKKYQHYEFEKSIKMTKQEVKDEVKNSDGNPEIKAKIKSIQMQFAMQRMMSAVPTATAVVTNPTHYAVAIRYDPKIAPAPQVVAKGVDFVAFKIKEIAKNNNIPIVENKPLARTMYKIVPLDGLIPAELYVAVAEVLAFVYKTNKGKIR